MQPLREQAASDHRELAAEEKAVLLTVPPEWLASGRVSEPDPAPLAQTLARVGVDWGD